MGSRCHSQVGSFITLNPCLCNIYSACKERLIAKAVALVEDVKKIESSASSKDALIHAAEGAAKTGKDLAEEMKATSASLGSDLQEAQVSS